MKLLVRLRRLAVAFNPERRVKEDCREADAPTVPKKENCHVEHSKAKQEEKGSDAQRESFQAQGQR
jgi:hypothetical protein